MWVDPSFRTVLAAGHPRAAPSLAETFPSTALLGPRWPVEFKATGHRQEEAASPSLV